MPALYTFQIVKIISENSHTPKLDIVYEILQFSRHKNILYE